MAAITLHGLSSKEKKYDRQLRLWGADGQAALEEAHILLINSGTGVAGIETLKNLILPGVGKFTIADSATIEQADLGANFFLHEEGVGHSRAKICCDLLKELNPDVEGSFISEPLEEHLKNTNFIKNYTLIFVVYPTSHVLLEEINAQAEKSNAPIIYIQSVGFFAHFSLSLPSDFPIVDTHPDPEAISDLRLLNPWDELSAHIKQKTFSLELLDDHEHGHVPYLILLLHYLEQWKETHGGLFPENYREKSEFRSMVKNSARTKNSEGGEENYDEAVAAVLKSLNPFSLSSQVREVFEASQCKNPTKESANFWIIASAVQNFHETHSILPLSGSLPDMKAQTKDYVELQNIYKSKARKDATEVLTTVRSSERKLGRSDPISDKEVEAFCKGARYIKLIRSGPALFDASALLENSVQRAKYACQQMQDPESLLPSYIASLAFAKHGQTADVSCTSVPASEDEVFALLESIWHSLETRADIPISSESRELGQKALEELFRARGTELHNISALIGGMAAQEAIKVLTRQYIPINNVCVFDGIGSRSAVFTL
ncbi:MAG: hypothetical protein M1829_004916 [Trizodia sp. TS-e1964]|nr:MAG: hypothetical protein M1829_004916 [Trizodia sp. TS-e1964]